MLRLLTFTISTTGIFSVIFPNIIASTIQLFVSMIAASRMPGS
jgi:hypothetical protein